MLNLLLGEDVEVVADEKTELNSYFACLLAQGESGPTNNRCTNESVGASRLKLGR